MESASPRSICHLRTEPVWPRGSLEEAELDQEPDRADDRLTTMEVISRFFVGGGNKGW